MFGSEGAGAGGKDVKDELVDRLLKGIAAKIFDRNIAIDGLPQDVDFFGAITHVLIEVDVHVGDGRVNVFKTLGICLVFELHPVDFPRAAGLWQLIKPTAAAFEDVKRVIQGVSELPDHYFDGISDHGVHRWARCVLECFLCIGLVKVIEFLLKVNSTARVKNWLDPWTNEFLDHKLVSLWSVVALKGVYYVVLIIAMVVPLIPRVLDLRHHFAHRFIIINSEE